MDQSMTQVMDQSMTQVMDQSMTQVMDHGVTQMMDHTMTQAMDHSVPQAMDHSVTQMGDTIPDPADLRPTVHVLVISDVTCPWCWVAKRSLESAMEILQDKFIFDVQFSPFLLRPKCPPEGVPNEDFDNEEHPRNQHLSEVCKEFNIDLTFSCPIVPCSVPALTLRQYVRDGDYPNVVQSRVADRLHEAYFTQGQQLDHEDLLQMAAELMLDVDEVKAYLADPGSEQRVLDQAQAWRDRGVQAVPFFYMNGKAVCSGAQDTKNFVQTILKVAERFPEQKMGDTADL